MSLSRKKKLETEYAAREDAFDNYYRRCEKISDQIADGYRTYIGLPNSSVASPSGEVLPYLKYYRINDEVEDGNPLRFVEAHFASRAITYLTEDYSFFFGFGILLERAPELWPKKNLQLEVRCKFNQDKIEIRIGDSEKCFALQDGTIGGPEFLHRWMHSLMEEWLAFRPETANVRRPKLGFAFSSEP